MTADSPKETKTNWRDWVLPLGIILAAGLVGIILSQTMSGPRLASSSSSVAASNVVVFNMADWIMSIPEGASPEEINRVMSEAMETADRLVADGYIVLRSDMVLGAPDHLRITPAGIEQ